MVQIHGSKILIIGCLKSNKNLQLVAGSRERGSVKSAKRRNQSCKNRSSRNSKNSYSSSYLEKSRSIKARKIGGIQIKYILL